MGIPGNDPVDSDQGSGEKDLASKFLDSLRGEAYIAAEDLGAEVLGSQDNIPKIMEKVRSNLFPLQEQGKQGTIQVGDSNRRHAQRQAGEPMTSYLSRRRRWWRKMKQQDKTVAISESILTICCWTMQGSIDRRE